ncbi:putative LRR receptor-like serine/threonine-protein kinase [Dorcoceras hygrometricum]|uniref:Putative LRR receptor-like serine/threonine-protein kinase n=1 Tax=Dorcoceras hygrometricum TaxID=472368 RepID=A0A2Z7AE47_9LAMI|nr:putative LRR receptor-like serine/threonine-protein kinase [Dorcoceras hygrometricum]
MGVTTYFGMGQTDVNEVTVEQQQMPTGNSADTYRELSCWDKSDVNELSLVNSAANGVIGETADTYRELSCWDKSDVNELSLVNSAANGVIGETADTYRELSFWDKSDVNELSLVNSAVGSIQRSIKMELIPSDVNGQRCEID